MSELPSGTVTFLVTDIEGSTRLLRALGADVYAALLATHDRLLDAAVEANGGALVGREGDGAIFAFPGALTGLRAALAAQQAIAEHDWVTTPRVRMALHSGEAEARDGRYHSVVLHEATRVGAAATGGQILVSWSARALLDPAALPAGASLVVLGRFRLRDVGDGAVALAAVEHPSLPQALTPPRAIAAHTAPALRGRTSFVGRVEELRTLDALRGLTRMLTLTGPGGVGKTRLAGELADRVADDFPDGVVAVELAPLSDPAAVARTVAAAAGVSEEPDRPLADSLADAFANRKALLVLDNCEHLLDAAASLVDRLLDDCPDLTVLATSREALDLAGEAVWPVPPLGLGDAVASDAMALFLDRAAAANPGFRLDAGGARAALELCAMLDGLPLALELAAARLRTLTVEQLLTRLDTRLTDLTAGRRTSAARHQTLRALLDWSHDLLSEQEQWALRRLAVFAGAFTLEAARIVVHGRNLPATVVEDLVDSLVRKSLVAPVEGGGFRLLETVREYGAARLEEAGETAEARDRHLSWLAVQAPRREGETHLSWLAREDGLAAELRMGFTWARKGNPAGGAALVSALGLWLWRDQRVAEAREWVEALLGCDLVPSDRFAVLSALTSQGWKLGDLDRAESAAREALELIAAMPEHEAAETSRLMLSLSSVAVHDDRLAEAEAICRGLLAQGGAPAYVRVGARNNLAIILASSGRAEEALPLFADALAMARLEGVSVLETNCVIGTAYALIQAGRPAEAVPHIRRSLDIDVAAGDVDAATEALVYSAVLAHDLLGRPADALRLTTASFALLDGLGIALPRFFTTRWFAVRDRARAALPAPEVAAVEDVAAEDTLETAAALAYAVLDAALLLGMDHAPATL